MTLPAYTSDTATVSVEVESTSLSGDLGTSIQRVEVRQELDRPGSCTITSNDLDSDTYDWIDGGDVSEALSLKVTMGYTSDSAAVFDGEVTGLELDYSTESVTRVSIRGYDRLHRLARGRRTLAFLKKKDSDIAADIAKLNGLTAESTATSITHEYVLQSEQTDLAFLLARARAIGFEVLTVGKALHFRPRQFTHSALLTVSRTEFSALNIRSSVIGQPGSVEIRGWDPANQKPLIGKAAVSNLASVPSGQSTGLALADGSFKAVIAAAPGHAITVQAVADAAAIAELETFALDYVTCEGSLPGLHALKPGEVLEIADAGARFSGEYYLTRVTHIYESGSYSTDIVGKRRST
ncbi:MAG: phage late control D family protein [Myxococcales bacterium]|nr:phage late control D family protein [Myxococcales bacterium]